MTETTIKVTVTQYTSTVRPEYREAYFKRLVERLGDDVQVVWFGDDQIEAACEVWSADAVDETTARMRSILYRVAHEFGDTHMEIKKMLTENTGRHFLDSGGAYGRHWERNQGRDFDNEPEATCTGTLIVPFDTTIESHWSVDYGLSVYHYLASRLDVQREMTDAMHEWADGVYWDDDNPYWNEAGEDKYDRSYWLEWKAWLDSLRIETTESVYKRENALRDLDGNYLFDNNMDEDGYNAAVAEIEAAVETRPIEWRAEYTENTYNGEDLLSQTIQFTIVQSDDLGELFETTDNTFILLTIHNGCDVRGGYTRFSIFTGDPDYLYDNAHMSLVCEDGEHIYDTDDAGYSWTYEGPRVAPVPQGEMLFDVNEYNDPEKFDDGLYKEDKRSWHKKIRLTFDNEKDGNPLCPICGKRLHAVAPYGGK